MERSSLPAGTATLQTNPDPMADAGNGRGRSSWGGKLDSVHPTHWRASKTLGESGRAISDSVMGQTPKDNPIAMQAESFEWFAQALFARHYSEDLYAGGGLETAVTNGRPAHAERTVSPVGE